MMGEYPVTKMIRELERDNLLPAILFRTARRQCDLDIEKLAGSKKIYLKDSQQKKLQEEIDRIIDKYGVERQVVYGHLHYEALIRTGSGAHHAGQLLIWRLLLEELMSRGMLRLLIATGTVAAGVDFPARTVIITAHSKRGSDGFNIITAAEFQQMSGRAGRRGKDSVGICLVAPSQYSDARVIHEVSRRPPEPLRSAYFAAPSTVLNLLKFRNVDDLRFTVSKSLASFLDRKAARVMRTEAEERERQLDKQPAQNEDQAKKNQKRVRRIFRDADLLEQRTENLLLKSLAGLEKLGYVEGGNLTEKGYWAAELCTSLVLEIAEAINDGIMEDLSTYELVGLLASISGDPHRNYFNLRPNTMKKETFEQMRRVVERVKLSYEISTGSDVQVLPDAALTVTTWLEAESWDQFSGLIRLAGVAEGDVARLVTQTADHLNQISRLMKSHPDLATKAWEGRGKILKPPISDGVLTE